MPRSVLLLETCGLKDMVAATPVLDALQTNFPGVQISLAATPASCEMMKNDPRIKEAIPLAAPWVFTAADRSAFLGSMARITSKTYDLAIDLDDSPENRLLLGFIAASRRVGRAGLHDFTLTHRAAPVSPDLTTAGNKLTLVTKIGARTTSDLPSIKVAQKDQKYVDDLVKGLNLSEHPLVGISTDAADEQHQWPDGHYIELVDRIHESHPAARILFFAAPANHDRLEKMSQDMSEKPSVLLLTIPRLAAFLERCDVYVGAHSGPSYIACALGVPSVLLYIPKWATKAPVGPHVRLLTAQTELRSLQPASIARTVNELLREYPIKGKSPAVAAESTENRLTKPARQEAT